MNTVGITITTCLCGALTAVVSYLIGKKKTTKQQQIAKDKELAEIKKRDRELKELCNYIAGSVDVLIQDTIKVTPEIRKNFKEFSERYHSMDLVPVPKK